MKFRETKYFFHYR